MCGGHECCGRHHEGEIPVALMPGPDGEPVGVTTPVPSDEMPVDIGDRDEVSGDEVGGDEFNGQGVA